MTIQLAIPSGEVNDPRGRAPIDPAIFLQPRTRIIVSTGQSMLGNWSDVPPALFNPYNPCYELNIFDGIVRQCDGGPVSNMDQGEHKPADQYPQRLSVLDLWGRSLCGLGHNARTLVCGLNIGGTPAAMWVPGTPLFQRAVIALNLLDSMGLCPTDWVHVIGHGDRIGAEISGKSPVVAAARFAADTARFIDGVRRAGYSGRIVLGLGCYQTFCSETLRLAIIAAQQQVIESTGITSGPNDDLHNGSDRRARADGCHWSETGRYTSFFDVNGNGAMSWVNYFPKMP
ncbi:hypothetical protein [Nitratidesulfovibrio liaohensis]|uniref:hypothetical protein n=1 Tax=Nitratidesulfovibrio liaohensis TaxID=2604158 RepID=UPI0014227BDE|nr:hypothetical protein [Nitratidesulfovibrio liaohensis]NHZ45507.1 hypothetical protein [Nitratidesulfovibrio liaohensis]